MKVFRKSLGLAFAGAALAAGALATPAAAADDQADVSSAVTFHTRGDGTQPPAHLGNPSEWGMVTITMDDSVRLVKPQTIVEVGGGTWSFGWNAVAGGKDCYSNYFHHAVGHSATVKIAGGSKRAWARANLTASAHLTGGGAYTCQAFWSKD
ncbi:lactococcin 972 family bacteriocin [Streptomyces europaeiscabiei]|uniref:lactococcin 972 family bacteriocin n=1 Tax=Streptomyces TaxID=1883 RepID=UPI000A36E9D0|nr:MULTISPECIES: lactococcin 972 family bacteriocin [Streptomyces]MDX3584229.1 lactococcin 972 family bacteriocin [Streptomyces europaeiscabiei]MDX3617208.1 lactococcin 972 family bacteriocin [Streptomyces europaeiscabiei]MDX3629528.1 lactococcin 972 family bacteriocin [Streptomyces europaeiscabiei]MDX3648145.1 lactococcin 972 family bacteriocin [Streptomyces europaeiscabiei]WUD32853.1 lactococcin 972 family bacteriocin [Streptomyces europaeiscabiei]